MHQIGVVGLSYRHAGVEEVARFAVPRAEVPARLPALRDLLKASEILYVGTCNRRRWAHWCWRPAVAWRCWMRRR